MKTLLAGLLLGALLCAPAGAASFNCRLASSKTEQLVCADPALSKLDEAMGAAYKRAFASTHAEARKRLVREQKAWLWESRSLCGDAACLRRSYATRVALLRECSESCGAIVETYRKDGDDYTLVIPRNPNGHNASFSEDLVKRDYAPVAACESLVEIPIGTASGNNSFGGICKIGDRNSDPFFMLCNDRMIGHFKLVAAAPALTQKQLIDFTIEHCFGG